MLHAIVDDPPYHTVYGFTRTTNEEAKAFYAAMGFDLTTVTGVYADGTAVVFSASYKRLCQIHGVKTNEEGK